MLVISIIALILSIYAVWVSWQNHMAIKSIMTVIEKYEDMIKDVLKK